MPQQAQETVNVRTPGGKVIPILKSDLATAIKRGAVPVNTAKEQKLPEEEGALAKVGRGAALGAFSGAGIAETMNPIEDTLKGLKEQATKIPWYDPSGGAFTQAAGIAKNLGSTGKDVFKDIYSGGTRGGINPHMDPEKISHDLASLVTQLLMLKGGKKAAETPISEGAVAKGISSVAREVAGAPLKDINKAQAAAEAANAEKVSAKTAEQSQAKAKARGEYEAGEAKRKAETDAAKKKFAEETAAANKERVTQSKAETARRSYEDLRDKHAESAAENLDKAEKMEKLSLDARYEDFRKKVLGVSKENPNGTLQADLSKVGDAVSNAKSNILKGSAESIKQFNDIMGKLKDFFETPEGEMKPLPGQKIAADQLHGYVTELNEKIYDSGVSGDVRDALKHVRDAAENSVTDSIKETHGKTAVKAYSELKGDYNDYMDTWRDTSSGSPLPNIRKILRQPMATKRGIPVYREIADILEGAKGEKALSVIARKKAFGADPALAAKLRKAGEKLSSLPKPKEVKPVERPEMPKPSTETKFEAPKPADVEPFNRREFVEKKVGQRANQVERYSLVVPAFQLLHDLVKGQMPGVELAAGPAMGMAIKKLLTSDKVIDWLSKEPEKGTAPTPERRSPTSKQSGPGGVNRRAVSEEREVLKESIANAEKKLASATGEQRGIIQRQIADFREMLAGL
jgi:hypothetical protein